MYVCVGCLQLAGAIDVASLASSITVRAACAKWSGIARKREHDASRLIARCHRDTAGALLFSYTLFHAEHRKHDHVNVWPKHIKLKHNHFS